MSILVAKVRSTRKGETTIINGKGTLLSKPGVGKDARRVWEIRKHGINDWSCSCPSFRYHMKGRPCKHMLKLFNEHRDGTIDPRETTLITESALRR